MTNKIAVPRYAQGSCGITHVDEGLLRYFWTQRCYSMLDIGCGPGGQVQAANLIGYTALGIDVDPLMYRRPGVALYDLCVQQFKLPRPADLVWSVETAEHIPPDCVQRYIDALTINAAKYIVLTASQMEAELHVSVHPREWWIEQVEQRKGWRHLLNAADIIEMHSTMQREFLRETGMIFQYNHEEATK